jgi:hypothetical protein
MTPQIEVVVRHNDGMETVQLVQDEANAQSLVKAALTPGNHMVCINVNGERCQRWDRERVVGKNRWRAVDPDSFEVVGPIREVFMPNA